MNKKILPIATTGIFVTGTALGMLSPVTSADDTHIVKGQQSVEANKNIDKQNSKISDEALGEKVKLGTEETGMDKTSDGSEKNEENQGEDTKEKEAPIAVGNENEIVKHILIEGNTNLPKEDILALITNTKIDEPYTKDAVKEDLKNISNSGIVQKVKARAIQNNGELYIVFDVTETSEIKSIEIKGNTLIETDKLKGLLVSKPNEQFNRENVEKDIDNLKQAYRDIGYVAIVSDVNNTDGNVTYNIAEAKIEDVVYSGNTKTKDWVLDKITSKTLKKGDFLTTEALQKVYDKLASTGFFKTVKIDANDGSSKGNIILNINVEEDKTGEWSLGGGYSNTYKAQLLGGIRDKNFRGEAKSIGFDFGIGKGKNNFSLSYVDPYWKKSDTKVYAEIFNSRKDIDTSYAKYTEKHTGGTIGFSKPITQDKKTHMYMNATIDNIKTDYESGMKIDGIKENTLTLGIIHDTREENQVAGTVVEGAVTTSQKFFGSDESYTKFMAQIKNYAQISAKDVLASRLKINYSPNDLPAVSQFTIGGADSVRGLDEDAQRGNKSILASLELRHDISKTVQSVIFVDAGKAWNEEIDNSLKVAAGLGVRIKTAMGVLRLDAAKAGGEGWKYMFGIGQSF